MRAALAALGGAAALLVPAAAGASVVAPPVVIDGPSTAISGLGGVALAPGGGGAVVYTKLAAGTAHVFASTEAAGAWSAPVQLDPGLVDAASAPSVAVADGGRAGAVWLSGGTLYGAVLAAGATTWTAPQAIAPASGVPALGMGISGTAYVAYATAAGNELDVARLDRAGTAFATLGALSATPVTLSGDPVIAVAADATAIAAWTQANADGSTHVLERRASAAGPSPVLNDLTLPTLGGLAGGSADSPQVGIAYDSSNGQVAYRETLGGVSRIVAMPILGDEPRIAGAAFADSLALAPGSSSASAPSLAVDGNAQGLLASELSPSLGVVVAAHGTADAPFAWTPGSVLAGPADTVAPAPLAALSQDGRGVVVYSPAAGTLAAEQFTNGVPAAAPSPVADAAVGTLVAGGGLAAAGDGFGDLAIAFLAGASGSNAVVVDPLVAAPGAPRATGTQLWTSDSHPALSWQPSSEHWAPVTYAVSLDGRQLATTAQTSYAVPELADGRHSWQVVARDQYGQSAPSALRRLLVDAAPPPVSLSVHGHRRHGSALTFAVATSAPSGIRSVTVNYGDGQSGAGAASTHTYAKRGRYLVTVTLVDRAGLHGTLHGALRVR